MSRRCWTCNAEHDLDAPCKRSPMATARRAAGGSDDLFDDPAPDPGPKPTTMAAGYRSQCPGCWDEIEPGEMITYTRDGWMHEECAVD